jgi:hypothetical protein
LEKKAAKKMAFNSSTDVKIASFEQVEKRVDQIMEKQEVRKSAVAMESEENTATATSSQTSIYQIASINTSLATSTKSAASPPSKYSSAPRTTTTTAGAETHIARDKYAGQKGISSDQFFGRDEEDAQLMRSRIGEFSGSSALSSDMLQGNTGGYQPPSSSSAKANVNQSIDALKSSVSGFFDEIKYRLG